MTNNKWTHHSLGKKTLSKDSAIRINEMLAKQAKNQLENWDLCLPQVLAASRVGISVSTQHSPFYLLYTRDPVLPLDNLLKPRRRYQGEDFHRYALERQHEAFMKAKVCLRKARNRAKINKDKRAKDDNFKVGDPVFVWNATKKNKLDTKWRSHFRITEQVSKDTFWVRNQLTAEIKKIHAKNLGKAWLEDWPTPDTEIIKHSRATKFVVAPISSPETSGSESDDSSDPRRKPKHQPEKRRQQQTSFTQSEPETSDSMSQLSNRQSIDQADQITDDAIRSDTGQHDDDPEPNRDQTETSEVTADNPDQVTTDITDSEDLPLARLRDRLRRDRVSEPVIPDVASPGEPELDSPTEEIVLPAAPRYPQRTRKPPAYLKDYCVITREGLKMRVSFV